MTFFYKIVNGLAPKYLTNYLNINSNPVYDTRASKKNYIRGFKTRTENFKHSFFPFCISEWDKLDYSLRNAESIQLFKSILKEFFNLKQKSLFSIHDLEGVKLLTRLRLRFSHLNEHKFRHNFKDTPSPMCDCGSKTETTRHFFLRCPFFTKERQKLLNSLFEIDLSLSNLNEQSLLDIILFGSEKFKDSINKEILLHSINFIKTTERFNRPLFDHT